MCTKRRLFNVDIFMEWLVTSFATTVILLSIAMLGVAIVEIAQSVRSEPAVIACRERGMDHVRRKLSSKVVCVPQVEHSVDTLIIRR